MSLKFLLKIELVNLRVKIKLY